MKTRRVLLAVAACAAVAVPLTMSAEAARPANLWYCSPNSESGGQGTYVFCTVGTSDDGSWMEAYQDCKIWPVTVRQYGNRVYAVYAISHTPKCGGQVTQRGEVNHLGS